VLTGKSSTAVAVYKRPSRGDNGVVLGSKRLRRRRTRRSNALKTVALAWSLWRWLPGEQRRTLLQLLRRHGPAVARQQLARRRKK
jgi:hypothetical protein